MKKSWKDYSHLTRKKGRAQNKKFIVEGVRFCLEALASGWTIEAAFATEDFQSKTEWEKFCADFDSRNIPYTILKNSSFNKLTDTEHPQGIALVVEQPHINLENLPLKNMDFLVILQSVRDPGNLGTIIRSSDWFGADAVIASDDCVELFNPKVLRSTMGSIFHIPVYETRNLVKFLSKLKNRKFKIVAASVSAKNTLETLKLKKPVALILGGEARGVPSEVLALSDIEISIRKFGKAESLNVAQAAAVASHFIVNQLFT